MAQNRGREKFGLQIRICHPLAYVKIPRSPLYQSTNNQPETNQLPINHQINNKQTMQQG